MGGCDPAGARRKIGSLSVGLGLLEYKTEAVAIETVRGINGQGVRLVQLIYNR